MNGEDKISRLNKEINNDIEEYNKYLDLEENGVFFNRSAYKDMRKEINREIMDKKIKLNILISGLNTVNKK
jgi:hypothetical protein